MTKRGIIVLAIVLFALMDSAIIKAMIKHWDVVTVLDFVIFAILNIIMYGTMRWVSKI